MLSEGHNKTKIFKKEMNREEIFKFALGTQW